MHAHCMVLILFFLMDDMQNPEAFHILYIFFEPSAVAEDPLRAIVCTANGIYLQLLFHI